MTDFAQALYGTPPASEVSAVIDIPPAGATTQPVPSTTQPATDAAPVETTKVDDTIPPVAITPEAMREAIEKAIPDTVKEQRADPARMLFNDAQTIFKEAIPADAFNVEGLDTDMQTALVEEVREMAADIGLEAQDIPDIAAALANPPTTEAEIISSRESAVELLNREYGPKAAAALNLARAFMRADPRRAAMLAPAGDNPQVVLKICRLAQQARAAGKF